MVENSEFLNRLRNGHLEKSAVTGLFHPSCSPTTAKTPAKVHLRLRFQNPGKPRTAGLCGRAAGACDCGPLSVLKSNGLRHPKNPPVKFGFSSKPIPTNIAKKLPSQRCSKSLFIAFFNFSHKRPTFAFTGESVYTLGPAQRIAHSGPHAETRAFRTGPLSLPSTRTARSRTSPGRVSERQTLPLLRLDPVCSRRTQRAFGTAMRLCASLFRGAAAPLGCVIFFASAEIAVSTPCAQGLSVCAR